jgi:hypothetical protein
MKVVVFCGGLGTHLRVYSETIPKPLVHIRDRRWSGHSLPTSTARQRACSRCISVGFGA